MAEAMPPNHASAGITTAQLFELAYTVAAAAPASTPTTPPMAASRIDSARNCVPIWLFVAPRARRGADLGAALQNGDDHDVGDTDGADDQCHHAESEEEAAERPGDSGSGGEHVRWLADVHS